MSRQSVGILIFFIFIGLAFWAGRATKSETPPKKITTTKSVATPTIEVKPAASKEELLSHIGNIFIDSDNTEVSVSFYDLKTGESFGINDKEAQHAASVTKVLTGAYLLKKVQDKTIGLSDDLGAFTVEFNLKQMVNQSNTEAWEIIDDYLGLDPQQEFGQSLGLRAFNMQLNEMSPSDAVTLFRKLYRGELLNDRYTQKLLSYMQNTETENLITAAIPKEVNVYHKTGLLEGEVHDVAIVEHPKHPFIMAIFTVNKIMPDYDVRAKLIQKAAAEAYAYFNKLP